MGESTQEAAQTMIQQLPETVTEALAAIDEHKGLDAVVMDMRGISGFTDFMVLCSGRSERHVQALAAAIEQRLAKRSIKPSHVEGRSDSRWVLLDYLDVVIDVFTSEARSFYQLEKLWREAPLLRWHEGAAAPE